MSHPRLLSVRLAMICMTPVVISGCNPDAGMTDPAPLAPALSVGGGGSNSPPTVHITAPAAGQLFALTATGAVVNLTANLTDPDAFDAHTCAIDWEAGTTTGTVVEAGGSGTCTGQFAYPAAGVYTIGVTVTDPLGATGHDEVMIVVYDPNGGFVTGGGWISSPAGAYLADPTLVGKATFGFVAKYKPGAATPSGNTEFQFHAAGMNFHATSYDWLVVSGAKAQYKGVGTINGAGNYRFMLTAWDGQVSGGGGVDRLRMRIWDDTGIVYDNELGAADSDAPTTALAGGSIVIHK